VGFQRLTSSGVDFIKFDKMFYRKDIAHRAFKPTAATREALTYASAGVSIEAGNEFVSRIKKVNVLMPASPIKV
jgi:phosphoribosylamine--glycine ligase/phosphoribosylformylglycinamidine cyclo-ligase